MTTFAELETLVVDITKRPEIPQITKQAIRTATLRAHHVAFFPADLRNATVNYTVPGGQLPMVDIPDISTQLARQRGIRTIQGVDTVTLAPVERFSYREYDKLYDDCGQLEYGVYTLVGDTLRIVPQAPTGRLGIYFYQNPVMTEGQYKSWIADLYPDLLAQWAAGIVSARTGFTDIANDVQREHVAPFKELLIASHLLVEVS